MKKIFEIISNLFKIRKRNSIRNKYNPIDPNTLRYNKTDSEAIYEDWSMVGKDISNVLNKCLHDSCPSCKGTGIGMYGPCVHYIACSCSKCTVVLLNITTKKYNLEKV